MSAMMVKQLESRTNSGDRYPTLVIAKVDWGVWLNHVESVQSSPVDGLPTG